MDTVSKCKQCRQPLEKWEAGICEGCGMGGQTLLDAYERGPRLPSDLVEHCVVHKYRIFCQWEHPSRDMGCVACWSLDSDHPRSNAECYKLASEAGYVVKNGRIECGGHEEDEL